MAHDVSAPRIARNLLAIARPKRRSLGHVPPVRSARECGVGMAPAPRTIFLVSPASLGGRRAEILLREQAAFPLARALRAPPGVPLGEVCARWRATGAG